MLAGIAPMRFFNRLGATEVTPDTICNMAGHVALRYMYGTSLDGFDPRTAKMRRASSCGAQIRMHRRRMPMTIGCQRRRARSSSSTPFARRPRRRQTFIYSPFPGSDAALALHCCT